MYSSKKISLSSESSVRKVWFFNVYEKDTKDNLLLHEFNNSYTASNTSSCECC